MQKIRLNKYFSQFSFPLLICFAFISSASAQSADSVVIKHHTGLGYYETGSTLNAYYTNELTVDSINQNELSISSDFTNFAGSVPSQVRHLNFYSPTNKLDSVAYFRLNSGSWQHIQNDGYTYDSYDSLIEMRHSILNGSSFLLTSINHIVFDSVANTRTETGEYYDFSTSAWAIGSRSIRSYDGSNRLIESFNYIGSSLAFLYDTKYFYLPNDSIDYLIVDNAPVGQADSIKFSYNLFGDKESEFSYRDSSGIYNLNKITTYNYDPSNKLTDIVNYGAYWGNYYFIDSANYSYNSMGLLEEIRRTLQGNPINFTHFEYTPDGVLDSIFSINDFPSVSHQDGDFVDTIWYEFSTIPTGITEQESEHLSIYPNPCNNGFILENDFINSEIESIEIFDVCGKKLFDKKYNTYESSKFVSTEKLSSGLYILAVNMRSGKRFSKRFVKQVSDE